MSRYTDQEKVESYLQRELTDREAVLLDYVISTVSDDIKTYTNRNWKDLGDIAAVEEEARLYSGKGYPELFIDDFEEISKVEYLDYLGSLYEEVSEADYVLYPAGTIKNSIRLRATHFPIGTDNIRVTGNFTSGTVPDLVIMAATKLAAEEILNSGDNTDSIKEESIEGYSYKLADNPDSDKTRQSILSSLDRLRKVIF